MKDNNAKCSEFFKKVDNSQKILVMDLGFLGDTVHMLPALWSIRQNFPKSHLEIVVSEHITSLLVLVPWIDKVWGYPRFPKGPKWYQDFGRVYAWRKEKYDLLINLNGSDRSCFLSYFIGPKESLGRYSHRNPTIKKWMFTEQVNVPSETMPSFLQKLECLRLAGFSHTQPHFEISIPENIENKIQKLLMDSVTFQHAAIPNFIHISPFTTLDEKELSEPMLVNFITNLQEKHSHYKIVLSCAPNERERLKLSRLLKKLSNPVWRTFEGNLTLPELATLIHKSKLHCGGDSGALHIALMMGTPTISWFREYSGAIEWLPQGSHHHVVFGEKSASSLAGVSLSDLNQAVTDFLR